MKIVYLVVITFVALSCAHVNPDSTHQVGIGFTFRSQDYHIKVTRDQLSNSPSWLEFKGNPPLAPGEALRIARAHLNSVVPDAKAWSLKNIIIWPIGRGKAVYILEFQEPITLEAISGYQDIFKVMVLMDGSVAKARTGPLRGEL